MEIFAGDNSARKEVFVKSQYGLHARPAGILAQAAQNFSSDIKLVYNERYVDAKSILDILLLAAGQGSKLEIRAQGQDAQSALEHLTELFEKDLSHK